MVVQYVDGGQTSYGWDELRRPLCACVQYSTVQRLDLSRKSRCHRQPYSTLVPWIRIT
jgi:hypothetical protein